MIEKCGYLTITAQKKLASQAVKKAFGKYNNYQKGIARHIIVEIVNTDPTRFIEFYDRYCTPKHDEIVTETANQLILNGKKSENQLCLF